MPTRRSSRHRPRRHRPRRTWARRAWWIAPVLAVLAAAGFYASRGPLGQAQAADPVAEATVCAPGQQKASALCPDPTDTPQAAQTGLGTGTLGSVSRHPGKKAARVRVNRRSRRHPASPSPKPSAPTASSPAPSRPPSSPPPSPAPPPSSSAPAPTPSSPAPPPTQQGDAAAQVLSLINQARAQAGLPAYSLSSGLGTSSSAHNTLMAQGCGLSHQCPGEPSLGQRETNAGVRWTAAGENIGEGGPVSDTSAAIGQMAVTLTQDMLNEKPPDDGHRLNILSPTFTFIGITVSRDSHGTVWMTQDFSN